MKEVDEVLDLEEIELLVNIQKLEVLRKDLNKRLISRIWELFHLIFIVQQIVVGALLALHMLSEGATISYRAQIVLIVFLSCQNNDQNIPS